MKYTGRRCSIESDFDIDEEILTIVDETKEQIENLKSQFGEKDYKKLARAIITEHLDAIVD